MSHQNSKLITSNFAKHYVPCGKPNNANKAKLYKDVRLLVPLSLTHGILMVKYDNGYSVSHCN